MGRNKGKTGVLFGPPRRERRLVCIACRRPILWGERCETCKRDLRRRQARKPR
jgi:hypothetical protein